MATPPFSLFVNIFLLKHDSSVYTADSGVNYLWFSLLSHQKFIFQTSVQSWGLFEKLKNISAIFFNCYEQIPTYAEIMLLDKIMKYFF